MRLRIAALLAGAWLASPGMALGQTVDRGNEVTVNPIAGGSGVLLYPGGQYMRVVHPALEPGETVRDLGPIHLHMPTKHAVVAARKAPAKSARQAEAAAAPSEPKVAPAPKVKEAKAKPQPKPPKAPKAVAAAQPQPAYNPGFGDPGALGAAGLNLGGMTAAAPAPAPSPPPARMAKANPPPANVTAPPASGVETPGLSKRSVILFAPQAADPAQSALGAIKFLAGDLNSAMTSASSRVQIQAYGGNRGDKGSDARRLSLKRALAIRQVLIDDGVPAERIDVRAMGGVDDTGPADRVDVFVKA
jgi:outer membrane protein OmpA-like peptidoglycan-associated protein